MNRADDRLPFRQATRLVNAFQFAVGSIGLAATARDPDRTVALMMIHRAALREPDSLRVSVHALAASLRRPAETIRRTCLALADDGYCERLPRGIARRADFFDLPPVIANGAAIVGAFHRMLDGFEASGFRLPAGVRDRDGAATLAAGLDIYLSVFELSESRIGSPMVQYALGAVVVLNAAAITYDPVLGERYGYDGTIPPDTLRRPASIRAIAALDGMPYSTLWRHLGALERAGAVRKVPGGYLLGDVYFHDALASARSREKIKYVRRVLNDLAAGR